MSLNTKVKLPEMERFAAADLETEVAENPLTAAFELIALRKVARLASELCTAIERGEKDIGGSRHIRNILADLGPACDAVEGR